MPKKTKKPDYVDTLDFVGYGRFSNTGLVYRHWKFEEDVPDLGVSKDDGQYLFDHGPESPEGKRFAVRHCPENTWITIRSLSDEEAKTLLLGTHVEWNPQGFHEQKVRSELRNVTKAVKDIIFSIERLIRAASPAPNARSKKASSQHQNSDTLEFLGEHTWSDGDPFWLWRFLRDYAPLDAEKGQILRQDSGDWYVYPRGCDDHRWVSPELACRVVRKWLDLQPGGTDYEGSDELPEVVSEDVTCATGRAYFSELNTKGKPFVDGDYGFRDSSASLCLRNIPEIGACVGDVFVFAKKRGGLPARMYGKVKPLELDDYQALRTVMLEFEWESLFRNLLGPEYGHHPRGEPYLKNPIPQFVGSPGAWGKQLRVFYSRIVLLKPWVNYRSLSDPISAASDEGAIWTLLHDAGCTLPSREGGSDGLA